MSMMAFPVWASRWAGLADINDSRAVSHRRRAIVTGADESIYKNSSTHGYCCRFIAATIFSVCPTCSCRERQKQYGSDYDNR